MVQEWATLLQRIRLWEGENRRPPGEEWPELDAALHALAADDWEQAIAGILGAKMEPMTASAVWRQMVYGKPVKEDISFQKVRVRMSQGVEKGFWYRAKGAPARYTVNPELADPAHAQGNRVAPKAPPRDDPAAE